MSQTIDSLKNTTRFLNAVIAIASLGIILTVASAVLETGKDAKTRCSTILDTKILNESLEIGTDFLINNQTPDGNFVYEYNWRKKTYTPKDSQVRQAGAAWGLALINQYKPNPRTKKSLMRALRFMNDNSKLTKDGSRFVKYPEERSGKIGTVALVALAHLDLLASKNVTEEERKTIKAFANQYLKFLLKARMKNGQWHQAYDIQTGTPKGSPSPYFDGESLLALVKAAKYHGYERYKDLIMASAASGLKNNIILPLKINRDSNTTKGYYQWASMAFYEISQTNWQGAKKYGGHVVKLANWMIDVHRTLKRRRNTAYAYEGIVHAYAIAKQRGDRENSAKFACTIDQGLEKLTTWQVGHSIANDLIRSKPTTDKHAIGGVQNHKHEPGLRIDVTQHQMHAVILALRHYRDELNL